MAQANDRKWITIFLVIIAVCCAFPFLLCSGIIATSKPDPVAAEKADTGARAAFLAEKEVRKRLRSPTTAEFSYPVYSHGKGVVRVTGKFTAQNGFGATISGRYVALCKVDPETKAVTLVNVAIE